MPILSKKTETDTHVVFRSRFKFWYIYLIFFLLIAWVIIGIAFNEKMAGMMGGIIVIIATFSVGIIGLIDSAQMIRYNLNWLFKGKKMSSQLVDGYFEITIEK